MTTATAPAPSSHPDKNPSLADWGWRAFYSAISSVVLVTIVGSVVEAIMAEAVMRTFLGDDGAAFSYLAAVCLVFVANMVAFSAGSVMKSHRGWAIGLAVTWATLGVAMVLIRFKHADFAVLDLPDDPTQADIDAAGTLARSKDYVSALFLLAMYVATGTFAAFKAKNVTNASLIAMLRAKSPLNRKIRKWANLQGEFKIANSREAMRLTRIDTLPRHRDAQLAQITAIEAAAKEQVRITQAEKAAQRTGNASETLMTLQPLAPKRPAIAKEFGTTPAQHASEQLENNKGATPEAMP